MLVSLLEAPSALILDTCRSLPAVLVALINNNYQRTHTNVMHV